MSFNQQDKNIERQYEIITTALDTGQRFVYDKQLQQFINVTKRQAHKLDRERYVTDLPTLLNLLRECIQQHGINEGHKNRLETAFDERAEDLENRFILYGRQRRNDGVNNLRQFKPTIENAAQQAPAHLVGV